MAGEAARDDARGRSGGPIAAWPEQVLERIAAFESLGVREIIVSPWVLPFAIHEPEQVELFAERVIAASRGS